MRTNLQRIVLRRIGSILLGLLGVFFLVSAAGSHIDNFRTRHIEYMQNLPIFITISVVFVAVGGILLWTAWRLWRVP